jgi:hypothetical protein
VRSDSRALSLCAHALSLCAQPVKLQRILEGVAVLFGTDDRTWAATRRMCFEGHLVQLMLRYDFKAVLPGEARARPPALRRGYASGVGLAAVLRPPSPLRELLIVA